jgi:hypothetical protein
MTDNASYRSFLHIIGYSSIPFNIRGLGYSVRVARCYQPFQFEVIAGWTGDSWELTRDDVLQWHRHYRAGSGGS